MKVALALLLGLATAQAQAACADLRVRDAWVRSGPTGARVLAGYLRLHNDTDRAITLHQASSLDADSVQFHRSTERGGMMRMESLLSLDVPGRSILSLEPQGLHLMLFGPTPQEGKLRLRLYCTPEDFLYLELPVRND